jgi:hypothetical protein
MEIKKIRDLTLIKIGEGISRKLFQFFTGVWPFPHNAIHPGAVTTNI